MRTAAGLTFEPYAKDGAPRLFVGMFRPPFSDLRGKGSFHGDRGIYYSVDQVREAWARGEFDRPLYTDGEVE